MADAVRMGKAKGIVATEKAIKVQVLSSDWPEKSGKGVLFVWIPQAAIHDDSEVWKAGDEGDLVVHLWFATERGWA